MTLPAAAPRAPADIDWHLASVLRKRPGCGKAAAAFRQSTGQTDGRTDGHPDRYIDSAARTMRATSVTTAAPDCFYFGFYLRRPFHYLGEKPKKIITTIITKRITTCRNTLTSPHRHRARIVQPYSPGGASVPPFNTQFFGATKVCSEAASRSVQPFLATEQAHTYTHRP